MIEQILKLFILIRNKNKLVQVQVDVFKHDLADLHGINSAGGFVKGPLHSGLQAVQIVLLQEELQDRAAHDVDSRSLHRYYSRLRQCRHQFLESRRRVAQQRRYRLYNKQDMHVSQLLVKIFLKMVDFNINLFKFQIDNSVNYHRQSHKCCCFACAS